MSGARKEGKMSNSKHTRGPWSLGVSGNTIVDNDQNIIAVAHRKNQVNAERIVACVNFCEGTDNAMLTGNVAILNSDLDRLIKLVTRKNEELMDAYSLIGQYRGQRDALLRAAVTIKGYYLFSTKVSKNSATQWDNKAILEQLSEAIATVKRHDHSKDPMMEALEQILKDSEELPHIHEIARKALEKGGAL